MGNRTAPRTAWWKLLDAVLIGAAFLLAIAAYRILFPSNFGFLTQEELALGFVVSVLSLWTTYELELVNRNQLLDGVLTGVGMNLILQAVLNYFEVLTRSLFLITAGGAFSAILLVLVQKWILPQQSRSQAFLIAGTDPLTLAVARASGFPVLGYLGEQSSDYSLPWLGPLESLEQRCLELQPGNLIVGDAAAHWLSPSLLWKLRLRGIAVSSDLDLYEEYFGRIHLRRWDPVGLLLSPTLTPNSQTLAVQAIYTNILGVALVLVTLPLILTLGLLILVTSGRPILDSEECSGFQNIPFLLLRFRTRDLKTGQLTLAGKLIETLHLKSLPNLFNILRGEIALFGPRPVRSAYTEYMRERLPLYTIRLAVKPGIMSWSPSGARIDELTRMEYDLYYVKLASIRFDVDLGLSYLWPDDRYSHSLDVPR